MPRSRESASHPAPTQRVPPYPKRRASKTAGHYNQTRPLQFRLSKVPRAQLASTLARARAPSQIPSPACVPRSLKPRVPHKERLLGPPCRVASGEVPAAEAAMVGLAATPARPRCSRTPVPTYPNSATAQHHRCRTGSQANSHAFVRTAPSPEAAETRNCALCRVWHRRPARLLLAPGAHQSGRGQAQQRTNSSSSSACRLLPKPPPPDARAATLPPAAA